MINLLLLVLIFLDGYFRFPSHGNNRINFVSLVKTQAHVYVCGIKRRENSKGDNINNDENREKYKREVKLSKMCFKAKRMKRGKNESN